MRKSFEGGFTLIQLMAIIAIVGIVAALALPAYQSHLIRGKVSDGVLSAASCKNSVAEAVQSGTTQISDSLCTASGQYVESITSGGDGTNATVTVVLKGIDKNVDGKSVVFTGTIANAAITGWACTTTVDQKFAPSGCATN